MIGCSYKCEDILGVPVGASSMMLSGLSITQ
jgi:hypothetical protein